MRARFSVLLLAAMPTVAACSASTQPAESPAGASEVVVAVPVADTPAAPSSTAAAAAPSARPIASAQPTPEQLEQLDMVMVGALSQGGSSNVPLATLQAGSGGSALAGALGGVSGIGGGAPPGATQVKGPVASVSMAITSTSGGNISNAPPVVAGMVPGMRRCYNAALRQDPGSPAGAIQLKATIGANGEVTAVTAPQTGGMSASVVACAQARVSAAQFAPPDKAPAGLVLDVMFTKQ